MVKKTKKISKFLSFCMLLSLTACFGFGEKNINIDVLPVEIEKYDPVLPSPILSNKFNWRVLTLKEVKMLNEQNNASLVFFALTPDEFKNLTFVFGDTIRYIDETNNIISFYKIKK